MKMNAAVLTGVVLSAAAVLVGFWGCGTGPLEQSYAIQSGAETVNSNIADKTDIPELMKQMRTANLNLVDRLTAGSSEQVVRAAAQVSIVARDVSKYQPAVAKGDVSEVAAFKRFSEDVKDFAVEVAKAADAGRADQADQFYVRMFLTCNQCHRVFRGVTKPSAPIDIPELETPKPSAPKPPEAGTPPTPAPAPETAPAPAPEVAPGPPN